MINHKLYKQNILETYLGMVNFDCKDNYAILPENEAIKLKFKAANPYSVLVKSEFNYNSRDNDHFLNVEEIRNLIKLHLDPNFLPI